MERKEAKEGKEARQEAKEGRQVPGIHPSSQTARRGRVVFELHTELKEEQSFPLQ